MPKAAKYSGISIGKNIIWVMALSGALAGLAGMSEITGVVHRLQGSISPGYGFTGIIIAWLAKLNPAGSDCCLHSLWSIDPGWTRTATQGYSHDDPGRNIRISDRK